MFVLMTDELIFSYPEHFVKWVPLQNTDWPVCVACEYGRLGNYRYFPEAFIISVDVYVTNKCPGSKILKLKPE